jgi:hypothetical protein
MNIRAGLAVLRPCTVCIWTNTIIDIAVDTLRNIKHFGATE